MERPFKNPAGKASTRRHFLKGSATALGAATVSALAARRPVHAAGADTIKLGLIGCGDRGPGAAQQALNADPGAKLIAMADVFADHVRESRDNLKKAKGDQVAVDDDHCFVGFDAWKKVIESGVDAVLIACASRFHPAYLRACVDAGKHVFLEKPHAIDPPGVHAITAACEEAKKKNLNVVSGLHRRYDPSIRETIQRVQDGAIGNIVAMEVSFMRAPYKIVERDPKWTEMEWQFKTWYHFAYLSGDDLPQSLIHTLDTGLWALREEVPVSAHALAGRSASIATKYGDVFDHAAVVYEFASGCRMYGFVRTQNNCHGEVAMKLFGSKGYAHEGLIRGETNWSYQGPNPGGHQNEQTEFMAALRSGKVINNGNYMARSTMTGVMAQMAAYTGKKVTWQQADESKFTYPPRDGKIDFTIDPPVKPDAAGIYPVPVPGKTEWT
jgi:myo-inositol 2-dehydrogenase/D-chiro-inositol 1-dehydrogenase